MKILCLYINRRMYVAVFFEKNKIISDIYIYKIINKYIKYLY